MIKTKESKFSFTIKPCVEDELDRIVELQEIAFAHIDNSDILRRNTPETFLKCLQPPHYTIGAYRNNELIAFAILYIGGNTSENIGIDIGASESELEFIANVKLIIVKPEFRGNSLQIQLVSELEKYAKDKGYKTLCATVSPDNLFSMRNFELMGYALHSCKLKYDGLKRNIYYKNI